MRRIIASLLIVAMGFSITGCATVMTGTTQKVPISSNPTGATVQIDGQCEYSTPCTVTLERKRDHVLVFLKQGYNQKSITILHVISGAVCGNILLGGLIGWGVDACTGAQYKLVPENVTVELDRAGSGQAASVAPREITTQEKINQLAEMYNKGQLTKEEYEANKKVLLYQMTGVAPSAEVPSAQVSQAGQVEKK